MTAGQLQGRYRGTDFSLLYFLHSLFGTFEYHEKTHIVFQVDDY